MDVALIPYAEPTAMNPMENVNLALRFVGLLGMLMTAFREQQLREENKRLRERLEELEREMRHEEVADLQRELQILREENEMMEETVAIISNARTPTSTPPQTPPPKATSEFEDAVINVLKGGPKSAGQIAYALKEAFPDKTKKDVNRLLYELNKDERQPVYIWDVEGQKKIWAAQ